MLNFFLKLKKGETVSSAIDIDDHIKEKIREYNEKKEDQCGNKERLSDLSEMISKLNIYNKVSTPIEAIEKESPLSAFFIKSELLNYLNEEIFKREIVEDLTYTYKLSNNELTYVCTDKLNPPDLKVLRDSKNREYDVISLDQNKIKVSLIYRNKSQKQFVIKINIYFGILDLKKDNK